MDKKKVIENIEDTLLMLDTIEGFDDGDTEQLLNVKHKLYEAEAELQKPDWISVEDELPPYFEKVFVCNKYHADNIWISHREDESSPRRQDENGFPAWQYSYHPYSITHWRKIDKLEV